MGTLGVGFYAFAINAVAGPVNILNYIHIVIFPYVAQIDEITLCS